MSFRRIMLKNLRGEARGTISLSGQPTHVTLPEGVTVLLCLTNEFFIPPRERKFPMPSGAQELSLIGEKAGEMLFATTLPPDKASFAKWRLLSDLRNQGAPREETPPEDAILPPEQTAFIAEKKAAPSITEPQSEIPKEEALSAEDEAAPLSADTPLIKAERLLERGTPFPLFESLMPNSRWAAIRDDDAEYLVGIKRDDDGEHILFGVPGMRDLPPDEDRLWTFFPTDEEQGVGYYLTEGGSEWA